MMQVEDGVVNLIVVGSLRNMSLKLKIPQPSPSKKVTKIHDLVLHDR